MEAVFCPRLHKKITPEACSALVCALVTSEDLRRCLHCRQGRELAASCPFDDRRRAARYAARHTEECLRAALRYVSPRYARDRAFGIRFLNVVAEKRCGWNGHPETLARAAMAVGLTVQERPWSIVRDKALQDFIL